MSLIKNCFGCCSVATSDDDLSHENKPLIPHSSKAYTSMFEKPSLYPSSPREQTINDIFKALIASDPTSLTSQTATKTKVDSLVQAAGGWQEWIAEGVLSKFIALVESGYDLLSDNLKEIYEKAKIGAEKVAQAVMDFAEEHPVYTAIIIVVIALGMIYLLAPELLDVLGFTSLGPRAFSWAARWQSLYGDVPKKCLFAYLQRLGMTIGKGVLVLVDV